jgi:hypothetical protein
MGTLSDFAKKARIFVIGGARSVDDPELFKKISLVALLAWVGLGADGLTSSCYGPEEAFLALGARVPLGIFVAAATAITIFVIAASYSRAYAGAPFSMTRDVMVRDPATASSLNRLIDSSSPLRASA